MLLIGFNNSFVYCLSINFVVLLDMKEYPVELSALTKLLETLFVSDSRALLSDMLDYRLSSQTLCVVSVYNEVK